MTSNMKQLDAKDTQVEYFMSNSEYNTIVFKSNNDTYTKSVETAQFMINVTNNPTE